MRNTTLGTHGPQVGVIGLGARGMSFMYDMAAPRDEATSVSVIHQALDLGVTLIDTADVYGPHTNEELLGRALTGHRDRAVLATKVGRVADRIDATPAQVALAWLLAQGPHVVPIPGTKTPKCLADNAGAAHVRLSAADLADLDAVPAPVGARYWPSHPRRRGPVSRGART
ncbi:aldo/keto reductase [Nonomuraea sp. NPDC003707]